jgi:hypothetical protein
MSNHRAAAIGDRAFNLYERFLPAMAHHSSSWGDAVTAILMSKYVFDLTSPGRPASVRGACLRFLARRGKLKVYPRYRGCPGAPRWVNMAGAIDEVPPLSPPARPDRLDALLATNWRGEQTRWMATVEVSGIELFAEYVGPERSAEILVLAPAEPESRRYSELVAEPASAKNMIISAQRGV